MTVENVSRSNLNRATRSATAVPIFGWHIAAKFFAFARNGIGPMNNIVSFIGEGTGSFFGNLATWNMDKDGHLVFKSRNKTSRRALDGLDDLEDAHVFEFFISMGLDDDAVSGLVEKLNKPLILLSISIVQRIQIVSIKDETDTNIVACQELGNFAKFFAKWLLDNNVAIVFRVASRKNGRITMSSFIV